MKCYKRQTLAMLMVVLELLSLPGILCAQQTSIKGMVKDALGIPIKGATIRVSENPNLIATTNKDGRFVIGANVGQHLQITGKEGNKIVTIHQPKVQVILKDTLRGEIHKVHIGYGMTRNRDELTAALGTYDNTSELSESMVINPENALYGRIPGLTVLSNGGLPPTSPTMYIRGVGTFRDNGPLILVDGFEWPLSSLSVDEIQSITVLKDAAVLTKYGQRGANGVLLVTTKRGTDLNGLHVSASYQEGVTKPTQLPSFVGAADYVNAINEARANDGRPPLYSPADVEAFNSKSSSPYLYPNVNWFNKTLRNHGVRSKFNVNFRGGGDRAHYFVLMNLINDDGLFGPVSQNSDYSTQAKYNRFRFRSNLNIDVTKNLLLKLDLGAGIVEENIPGNGSQPAQIFNALYQTPSAAFPVTTPDGSVGGTQTYNGNNPVAMLTHNGFASPNSRQFSVTGTLQQDLSQWIDGLNAEAAVSFRNFGKTREYETKQYSYKSLAPVRDSSGVITGISTTKFGQNTDLNYNSYFNSERQFSDVLGKVNYQSTLGYNDKFGVTILYHQSSRVFNGQDNTYNRKNLVGNLRYSISNKYFFGATASYSGNNKLKKGNRFVLLPAVSAGWLISNEDFMQGISFLDQLKLRASWGISGSDLVPTNNIYELNYFNATGYHFKDNNSGQGGFAQGQLPTTNLTDARSHNTNVGIDATFFNKLNLSVDLFYERRTNILTSSSGRISDVIGFESPLLTDGVVKNKGLEAALSWEDKKGNWAYHIGGQFSYTHNKIVNEDEQYRPYSYLKHTGESVGQPFGLVAIGYFKNQNDIENSPQQVFSQVRPGDIKYKDQNGDGVIDQYDEVPLGYPTNYPEIYYSASLGLSFKGLSVSALFQGTENYSALLNTQSLFWPIRNNNTISNYYYNRRWTPQTKASAQYPRLTTQSNNNNFRSNSVWLVNRSYIKLRNLEIAYSLPVSVTHRLKMDKVRFFIQARNMFSIDNIPVMNPEQLYSSYPILRSYSAGLKIAF